MKIKTIYHNLFGSFSNFAFLLFTGIILVPFYFKYISVDDYGIWLGGISFISLLTVLEANISLILTQQLADKWTNKKPVEFSKYFSAAIVFSIFAALTIIISVFFLKDSLYNWVGSQIGSKSLFLNSFLIYSVTVALGLVCSYLGSIPQVFQKTLMPPLYNIISSFFGIVFTIYTVPIYGVLGIAIGSGIKYLILTILLSCYVFKLLNKENIIFSFELKYLRKLIYSIGWPFVSKLLVTVSYNAQNFIVAAYITSSAVTIFDITRKLPFVAQTVVNMVGMSTFTAFSLFYSEQNNAVKENKYLDNYFSVIRFLLLTSVVGLFLLGKDFIGLWVGIDKYGGDLLFILLCITLFTDQLRVMLGQQYYAIGQFKLTSLTDAIFSLSFIILTIILLPIYKLYGIPLASIISVIIYFILCFFAEKRNNIHLTTRLINKSMFYDIFSVILVLIILNFVFENYLFSFTTKVFITSLIIILFSLIFGFREKQLLHFIYKKIKSN